jgi:hypothetical protein
MKTDPKNNENTKLLTTAQEKRILELESVLQDTEKRARDFQSDWSNMFDQNKILREENHRIQHGYEVLRIQKGGFGFKMLLLSGLGGFVTALLLCFVYLKLKPKPDYVTTFDRFRRENLFDYELALSNGNFEAVEASLGRCKDKQEYQNIQPEIVFTQKVVGAAKRFCQQPKPM